MSKSDIHPFISADDWKALGPMGRVRQTAGATEREGIYDNNIYDGGPSDAVEAERPYQAHIWLGGPNKVLGNPNRSGKMDDFSLAHSQYFHFMEVLSRRDENARKLIVEAARAGNKASVQAAEIEGGKGSGISYAEASQMLMDRYSGGRTARAAGKNGGSRRIAAKLTGDEIDAAAHTISANGSVAVKASPSYTVIAPTAGEARVLREFINTALSFYPPETQFHGQKLPKSADDIDFDKIAAKFREAGRPDRFGSREDGKKAVGIFASSGLENQAAEYVSRLPSDIAVAPQKGHPMWDALMKIDGRRHWRLKEFSARDKSKAAAIQSVVDGSDVVTVFWSGDHRDDAFMAAAYAARAGKLGLAFGPDGREMNVYQMATEAKLAHMSAAEAARAQTLPAFDMPVDSPEGRLALSLVHTPKDGSMSDRDMNRIASLGMTLNELNDMAATDAGRDELMKETRISGAAAAMLGNDKVMSSARDAYLRINDHMKSNNVSLIGPESYPDALLASGDIPPYLFVQGDTNALRENSLVGVVGETSTDPTTRGIIANRTAPALSALSTGSATPVEIEGTNDMTVPVNGPHVLVLTSGHTHGDAGKEQRRQEILEKGGIVISKLPPVETTSFYHVPSKETRGVPSTTSPATERAAARLLGSMSEGLVLTQMSNEGLSPARVAVLSHLEAGRRPAAINFDDVSGIRDVAGNRAMTSRRGEEAFEKAGFLEADTIGLKKEFSGSMIALDAGRDPERAMSNLVRHIKGESLDIAPRAKSRIRQVDENEL